jgi:hypothetical protein
MTGILQYAVERLRVVARVAYLRVICLRQAQQAALHRQRVPFQLRELLAKRNLLAHQGHHLAHAPPHAPRA